MTQFSDRIIQLSDAVKKKIAAGEVIEGPFSAVKELIENSIDAGASSIDVKITGAGLKKIVVADDGRGIFPDDIESAVAEHATSKIKNAEDISSIISYGFRGEALSSLSSISRLTILSRRRELETGARLETADGKNNISAYAGPAGTIVIAENLFYSVPARKKFLRAERAELRRVREVLLASALANHRISFTLESDEKRIVTLPACESETDRITQIYGKEVAISLTRESITDIKVKIEGWFSKLGHMRASRSMQSLFVNGRPVEHPHLSFHLSRAYESIAAKGEYPAALIFITLEPALVDVNVHPAKREVKLFDRAYIDSLIFQLAKKAIESSKGLVNFKGDHHPSRLNDSSIQTDNLTEQKNLFAQNHPSMGPSQISREFSQHYASLISESGNAGGIMLCGIAFATYIIAEKEDTLYLIDFHAAHERMIFDSITGGDADAATQDLLFPNIIELSPDEHAAVMDGAEYFAKCGFVLEDFSDNSIIIRGMPALAKGTDPEDIIREFLGGEDMGSDPRDRVLKKIAASVACKAARRAGEGIPHGEAYALAEWALERAVEKRCPHGRPFVRELTKSELDRMFIRT